MPVHCSWRSLDTATYASLERSYLDSMQTVHDIMLTALSMKPVSTEDFKVRVMREIRDMIQTVASRTTMPINCHKCRSSEDQQSCLQCMQQASGHMIRSFDLFAGVETALTKKVLLLQTMRDLRMDLRIKMMRALTELRNMQTLHAALEKAKVGL